MNIVRSAAIAIGTVAMAAGAKTLLNPMLDGQAPFLLFFTPIFVSAFYGGYGAGVMATILSTVVVHVVNPMDLQWYAIAFMSLLFIAEGIGVTVLVRRQQQSEARLRKNLSDLKRAQRKLGETNTRALAALDEALDWGEERQRSMFGTKN